MANNEILKLTKSFALRIIRMAEFLFKNYPHNRVVDVLGKQVLRSGTSKTSRKVRMLKVPMIL